MRQTRLRDAMAADVAADLVVVGGGLVGLATSVGAAERGMSVTLFAVDRPGAASRAGAGLLVPHYRGEGVHGEVARFMTAARDQYPAYVRTVEERSGIRIPLDQSGAIELASSAAQRAALYDAAPHDAERLTAAAVAEIEPALAPTAGGVLYPRDGAVDNMRLTDALASIVERDPHVRVVREAAVQVVLDRASPRVVGAAGTRAEGRRIVLAAGAWSGDVRGLPRSLPVRPLRGQICTVATTPLRHVVLGADVYMVARRGDRTLIGSTMEDVGFDAGTTPAAIERLRRAGAAACPTLGGEPLLEAWGGLRPATPDLLPILGVDPTDPRLIYACGHSRNGILLAPITAAVTCAIAAGDAVPWDLAPFAIARFHRGRPTGNRQ
ncbi:MAG: FAD-dependent oxidoreductase [Gemmatimonadota bacterium]|nr:FAD-dependent oxidoreductase [Gemmatimonadota bacterium]